MIQFGARSHKLLEVLQDLIEGSQPYPALMTRLQAGMARTLLDLGGGRLRETLKVARAAGPD
jgi:hypothetical protein